MSRWHEPVSSLNRGFWLLWSAETSVVFASTLSQFALSVWVFARNGSVAEYAFMVVSGLLPALLVMPLAAHVADRFDKRRLIVGCDVVRAGCSCVLISWGSRPHVDALFLNLLSALATVAVTIRSPVYRAAVAATVDAEQLTRANAALGVSAGGVALGAPLVAACILKWAGYDTLMLVALGWFSVGPLLTWRAAAQRGPSEPAARRLASTAGSSPTRALGWLWQAPSAFLLLGYVAMQAGLLTMASTLLRPLVLSRLSVAELAWVMMSGGLGGVMGALCMLVLPKGRRLMPIVLVAGLVLALTVVGFGLSANLAAYCAFAFLGLFAASLGDVCARSLWMRITPAGFRGSVLALVAGVSVATAALVLTVGGALVDQLLVPALGVGGSLSRGALFRTVGGGPGGAIAAVFLFSGSACALISLLALTHSRARELGHVNVQPAVALASEPLAAQPGEGPSR